MLKRYSIILVISVLAAIVITSCNFVFNDAIDNNKQMFVKFVDAINARQFNKLDAIVATNYVRHCQATSDVNVTNLAEFKEFLGQDTIGVPDSHIAIKFMAAEADLVAFYCTYEGTQTRQMGIFPPLNKHVMLEFAGVHKIAGGKIAETWLTWDNISFLTQLGHFPQFPSPEGK